MSSTLYLEGGGSGPDSKGLQSRCREGFRTLLEKCELTGRMPRLVACGGRTSAFDDFKTALRNKATGDYVAMLIDSEAPLANLEAAWEHLRLRPGDNWERPPAATDDQVLFMTTCMETWIVADREVLRRHYGSKLQSSALPPLTNLEARGRHDVQDRLAHATRNCPNAYTKGKRSFEILAKLTPAVLEQLPSFVRARRILNDKL
ncbi:MAG TPA: DUF4276 family protein [Blastocatellia bacterium]|nr:DUF4276 family protein [Blastocatellia bacterium]